MVEQWERYKHIASLILPLLMLLIGIYDGFDTYNMMIICMSGEKEKEKGNMFVPFNYTVYN